MARRANGEGSIYRRSDGRWAGVYTQDGKRRFVYGKTQREASLKLADARRNRDQGLPPIDNRLTLNGLFAQWLAQKRNTVRESTLRNYDQRIRVNVLPTLGTRAVSNITPQDLSDLYQSLMDGGKSPRTVRHVHTVLGNMLRDAEGMGVVGRNVARLVRPPQPQRPVWTLLNDDQIDRFLDEAVHDKYSALWEILATTGMRVGEALAIRWADLYEDWSSVRVQSSLAWRGSEWYFDDPKTDSSTRTITIPPDVIEALESWVSTWQSWYDESPAGWMVGDLMFVTEFGRPLHAGNLIRTHFRPILKRAGLPTQMRIHDLRHSWATNALLAGANPVDVSGALGHSNVSTTLSIYAHATPDASRRVNRTLGRIDI